MLELKTRKAHPEHFGQLGFYVSVVDDLVRDKESDGPTIGILIAESRDRSSTRCAATISRWPSAPTPVCPTGCASRCPAPRTSPGSPTVY